MALKNCILKTQGEDGIFTWQELPSSTDSNCGTDRWECDAPYTTGSAYTVDTDTPGKWLEDWWNRSEWRYTDSREQHDRIRETRAAAQVLNDELNTWEWRLERQEKEEDEKAKQRDREIEKEREKEREMAGTNWQKGCKSGRQVLDQK